MVRAAFAGSIVLVFAAAVATSVEADDWPSFRGPTGQGHSVEEGLPIQWAEGENVSWKTPVAGLGWSSPVVADGRVWLTTAEGGSLRLVAFDAEKGNELVNVEVFGTSDEKSPNPKNSLASPTPVVDTVRGQVYVHFGASGTAALTTSGDVVWTTEFPYTTQHGNGGSPILFNDLVILSCDGYDQSFIVAVDAETGEVRWKTDRAEPISQAYSTPVVIDVNGQNQLLSIGAFRTNSLDPETGEELWEVGYPEGFSNVPAPVYSSEHGLVFISTGFQQPSLLAVRSDGSGDVTNTHIAWRMLRGAPHTPSPLVVGDELYIVNDTGIATCVDVETGEVRWRQRFRGNFSASPVFADGRIYFQSEEGITTVIEPSTEFVELARNEVNGRTLASLAVSEGAIFLRSDSHLYRIETPGN